MCVKGKQSFVLGLFYSVFRALGPHVVILPVNPLTVSLTCITLQLHWLQTVCNKGHALRLMLYTNQGHVSELPFLRMVIHTHGGMGSGRGCIMALLFDQMVGVCERFQMVFSPAGVRQAVLRLVAELSSYSAPNRLVQFKPPWEDWTVCYSP